MSRCVFIFDDKFVNIEADEFHEDGKYLKAYLHNELVGIFRTDIITAAYRSDERGLLNDNRRSKEKS